MIGYYIHHQGLGHLARSVSICARMRRPVTALTSLDVAEPHPFSAIVKLPRDDAAQQVPEPTAHGAPQPQPEAVVVDVSVEVATFVRLLGVPVIVMALPGKRVDAPHLLVHRIADHIVAAWPRAVCVPSWLRQYEDKTTYAGGISRVQDPLRAAVGHL